MSDGVSLSSEQISALEDLFRQFDVNGDGELSQDETFALLQQSGIEVVGKVDEYIEALEDEHVNFREFCRIVFGVEIAPYSVGSLGKGESEALKGLREFKILYIKSCADFEQSPRNDIVKILDDMAQGIETSTTLNLCRNNPRIKSRLLDSQIFPLFDALGQIEYAPFSKLDISFNGIRNPGAQAVAAYLEVSNGLLELNMAGNNIEMEGGAKLAEVLASHRSLQVLNLSTNPLGDKAVCKMAQMLAVNRSLTEVNLGNTDAGQLAEIQMASMLKKNVTLESLNIDRPLLFSIEQETGIHVAKSLPYNSSLTRISLRKQGVTDYGTNWISEYLSRNSSILYLDLGCNRITMAGVVDLIQALAKRDCDCLVNLNDNLLQGMDVFDVELALEEANDSQERVKISFETDQNIHTLTSVTMN